MFEVTHGSVFTCFSYLLLFLSLFKIVLLTRQYLIKYGLVCILLGIKKNIFSETVTNYMCTVIPNSTLLVFALEQKNTLL